MTDELLVLSHPAFADAAKEWREATTHRQRTALEYRIGAMATPAERGGRLLRELLQAVLGGSVYPFELRSRLRTAPEVVWDYVDAETSPLSLYAVVNVVRKLRKQGLRGHELDASVAAELARLSALPVKKTRHEGVTQRRVGIQDSWLGGKKRVRPKVGVRTARALWFRLREVLVEIVAVQIPANASDLEKRELTDWMEREFRAVNDAFNRRLLRVRRDHKAATPVVTRRHVMAACQTLMIDPPKPGHPLDLGRARRAKLRLARSYHPDSNGGNADTATLYQGVIEAFDSLEEYMRQLGSTKPEAKGADDGDRVEVGTDHQEQEGRSPT